MLISKSPVYSLNYEIDVFFLKTDQLHMPMSWIFNSFDAKVWSIDISIVTYVPVLSVKCTCNFCRAINSATHHEHVLVIIYFNIGVTQQKNDSFILYLDCDTDFKVQSLNFTNSCYVYHGLFCSCVLLVVVHLRRRYDPGRNTTKRFFRLYLIQRQSTEINSFK